MLALHPRGRGRLRRLRWWSAGIWHVYGLYLRTHLRYPPEGGFFTGDASKRTCRAPLCGAVQVKFTEVLLCSSIFGW